MHEIINPHSPPLLAPGNHRSVSEFNYSRHLISVESYSIWPSLIVLFHLMFPKFIFESVRFPSFCRLNNIPLYVYSTFYLFICHWDWLHYPIVLLWTGGVPHISLQVLSSILLGIYPRRRECWITQCLFLIFLRNHHSVFHSGHTIYIPINNIGFQSLYILANLSSWWVWGKEYIF